MTSNTGTNQLPMQGFMNRDAIKVWGSGGQKFANVVQGGAAGGGLWL
jgi:hypothetical protein